MSYWVLYDTVVPESRTTAQKVTETQKSIDEHICKLRDYDDKIATWFKEPQLFPNGKPTNHDDLEELVDENNEFNGEF